MIALTSVHRKETKTATKRSWLRGTPPDGQAAPSPHTIDRVQHGRNPKCHREASCEE